MSSQLPVSFQMGALPPSISGQTPQQLADLIAANLTLLTANSLSLFVAGSAAPTSDSGPWWMNNTTWRYWNAGTGDYQPQILESESLRYILAQNAPDPLKYDIWVVIDSAGKAQGAQHYVSGAWHDIYEDIFSSSPGKTNFKAYSIVPQTVVFAGAGSVITQIVFGAEAFDSQNTFADNKFIAPSAGVYQFVMSVDMSVSAGAPTGNKLIANLLVNGGGVDVDVSPDTSVNDRTMRITSMVSLNAGDVVTANMDITVTAAGTWTINSGAGTALAGYKVA